MSEEKVCPRCWGREVIEKEETHFGIPITEPCQCAVNRDIRKALNSGWAGVAKAKRLKSSPLEGKDLEDVFITANDDTLRSHLLYVGARRGRNWSYLVASDADLMSAWLATKKYEGHEIFDRDAREIFDREALRNDTSRTGRMTLEDLVEPPGLLVLRLGVKSARNSAMPEVFLEALHLRDHLNRPTWVADRPGIHRFNGPGTEHRCYSPEAEEILLGWPYFELDKPSAEDWTDGTELPASLFVRNGNEPEDSEGEARARPKNSGGLSLSGASGVHTGATRTVEAPKVDDSKGRRKSKL